MTSIRILLAEDHSTVRVTIRKFLNAASGIEVVGEASNGIEALSLVKEVTPDVLLLDMEMPQLTGIEVARRLQAIKSPISILALSTYDDWAYIQGLLDTGAAGYLTKDESPEFIIEAVRAAARGEQGWVGPHVARKILASLQPTDRPPIQIPLTQREKTVLRLMTQGKTNLDIGRTLELTEKMVEIHLLTLYAKLGVTSRAAAIKCVIQEDYRLMPIHSVESDLGKREQRDQTITKTS